MAQHPARLIFGDCLAEMACLPDASVDAVICDLPYGTTACKWDTIVPIEPLWAAYKRLVKPAGVVVLTACQPFTSKLVMSNPSWFRYEWAWDKGRCSGHLDARWRPLRRHENILVFSLRRPPYTPQFEPGPPKVTRIKPRKAPETLGGKAIFGRAYTSINPGVRYPQSVLAISNTERGPRHFHPTQKSLALMEYLVKTYTVPGMTVLDNCMGSGTTGEACTRLGRGFVGIEDDPDMFPRAEARIRSAERALPTPA